MTQFANMVYPMLTLILKQHYLMSAARISVVLAIDSAALLLASYIGGKLADAFNRKKVIVVLDLVSASLYLTGALIPFSKVDIVLIILAGACQQAELASYNTLIDDFTNEETIDKGYSNFYLFFNIGAFASTALAGFLVTNYLRIVFIINSIGILSSTLLIAAALKVDKKTKPETGTKPETDTGFKPVLLALRTLPVLVIFLLVKALWEPIHNEYSYLVPMELDRILPEGGAEIYGTLVSFSCACVVLFTTLVTKLVHRYSVTAKIQLSNIAQGLGYVLVFVSVITDFIPLMYAGFLVYIVGEILDSVSYETYIMENTPDEYKGRMYGIFSMTLKISVMIFNLLLGFLYDKSPYIAWAFMAAAVTGTVVLTCWLRIAESRKGTEDRSNGTRQDMSQGQIDA